MHALKSWFLSGGSWFILAGLWLVTWLLGVTNSNASSSVWMLPLAVLFLVLGIAQMTQARRRNKG